MMLLVVVILFFINIYSWITKNYLPSYKFLTWFIGFSEGNSSFTITSKGDLQFVIIQNTRDIQVLEMIKNTLRIGSRTSRFIIQDKKGLELIVSLFNGIKRINTVKFLDQIVIPSLEDSWLSGYSDAEAFRIKFLISQKFLINKPVLDRFIILFNTGRVILHSQSDTFTYEELYFKLKNKDHLDPTLRPLLKVLASKVNNTWD
ncbi:hypothetical protein BJ085DRAFT_41968 [Dimargaris cristalligena]|uniref:Homing endonuclease LAGLIDADG domain-containing protein n=1 Tax=Dimargaris cristalligena TaxID=215637 RepID=A0A4P9ZPW1_9FUNG|nr:hypothetical protein BJ085DRAFT_41968 [Dimargaris cristalligena]|eukprot:RKP34380.1 hypothetical protein BJ085DRAFT_41968 [Dimargaris cristalligena]